MGLWTDNEERNGTSYEWLHVPARPAPPPAAPPPPTLPRRRRKRFFAALAAGVIALGALTSFAVVELTGDDGAQKGETVAPLSVSTGPAGETRIKQIYERVAGSVVSIQVATGGCAGSGSGFVVGADGTIVTNDHVVEDATAVQVRFDDNGQPVRARVVGADPSSDLAVIKVDPDDAPPLKPLTLADSDSVTVGDNAIAIGYPLGLDRTATAGIISGLGRTIQAPNNFSIDNVIQTDAPINPGNSGGPLLNARGQVIGVNTQISTGTSVGVGFAIPSNTVREVLPRLGRGQSVRRAYLGVSTTDSTGAAGAQIATVTPDGPAERAGLRPGSGLTAAGGDVIVSVDGHAVGSPDDLSRIVGELEPGDKARVEYLRDGQRRSVEVTLDDRPQIAPSTSP